MSVWYVSSPILAFTIKSRSQMIENFGVKIATVRTSIAGNTFRGCNARRNKDAGDQ